MTFGERPDPRWTDEMKTRMTHRDYSDGPEVSTRRMDARRKRPCGIDGRVRSFHAWSEQVDLIPMRRWL